MLEGLRKRRNSIVVAAVFAVIIIVFIFWGVGPGDKSSSPDVIALVNGEEVTVKDFSSLYNRQYEYYKSLFGGRFSKEMAENLGLKKKALDILINRRLALREAKREGVTASDVEIQEAIMAVPSFKSGGSFDRDLYFRTLSSNRIKPAEFERSIAEDIVAEKMQEKAAKDVLVTDEEVREAFLRENRRYNLGYATLDALNFASRVKVEDAEAMEYLKRNASQFVLPVRINAFYAYAPFSAFQRSAAVTDGEVREYYDKNPGQFEAPEKVRARHILVRPDEKEKDREKAANDALALSEGLLKRIKKGEKFSDLAKRYSDDPGSKKGGGELGWFQRGVMVRSFEDAVFALKKGEVSGVVSTEFGYHIILVEERAEAGPIPFGEARGKTREMLLKQKAWTQARDAAREIERAFKEAKDADGLKKAASAHKGASYASTGLFSAEEERVEFARDVRLKETALSLKTGEVGRPVETDKGIYVMKIIERVEAHTPDFKDIAFRVRERLRVEKAREEARKTAVELIKKAASGEDVSALLKKEKLRMEETGYFTRAGGFIPKVGVPIAEYEKVLLLKKEAPYYAEPVNTNGKFHVIRLKDVKEADESIFEKGKNEIRERLLSDKREAALGAWLEALRSKAKIRVFEDRIS